MFAAMPSIFDDCANEIEYLVRTNAHYLPGVPRLSPQHVRSLSLHSIWTYVHPPPRRALLIGLSATDKICHSLPALYAVRCYGQTEQIILYV
jgi:hypothetical protein